MAIQTKPFSTRDILAQLAQTAEVAADDDGLEEVPAPAVLGDGKAIIPDWDADPRLKTWLLDLRLLRHVPLVYLLPDPDLLPPESIRFFHVDPTWVDRLVEGSLSAVSIGALDQSFAPSTLATLRKVLDQATQLDGEATMTGLLIRSQLIKRWPTLVVNATLSGAQLPIVRKDILAQSLMIVLIAGVPDAVTLNEPAVGVRFGVDFDNEHRAETNPEQPGPAHAGSTPVTCSKERVIDIQALADQLAPHARCSRSIAIALQQKPYQQLFRGQTVSVGGLQFPRPGSVEHDDAPSISHAPAVAPSRTVAGKGAR